MSHIIGTALTNHDCSVQPNSELKSGRPYKSKKSGECVSFCGECRICFADQTPFVCLKLVGGSSCFGCELCDETFSRKRDVELHIKTHTEPQKHCYTCFICGESFPTSMRLDSHMKGRHSGTKKETFPCDFCSKTFSHKSTLSAHRKVHKPLQELRECVMCSSSTCSSHDPARAHLDKPVMCQLCGKRFTKLAELKRHSRTHSGERPFSCTECGQSFGDTSNLKRHLLAHSGDRPLKCTLCGKGFTRQHNLNIHLRMHTGEKPFECDVCGKKFTQRTHVKTHQWQHRELHIL